MTYVLEIKEEKTRYGTSRVIEVELGQYDAKVERRPDGRVILSRYSDLGGTTALNGPKGKAELEEYVEFMKLTLSAWEKLEGG